jgi:hypothetical protein
MTENCNAAAAATAGVDGKYLERMPLFRGLGTEVIAETDLKLFRDQVCLKNAIFVVVATHGNLSAS